MKGLDEFLKEQMPLYKDQLASLVRIPSISGDPEYTQKLSDVVVSASNILNDAGFTTKKFKIWNDLKEYDTALGAFKIVDEFAPWILIYNHLDVQPSGDLSKWNSDPFDPVLEKDKIIGRGTTDDKGPALAVVYAVRYLMNTNQLPVNVGVVYETAEETGSQGFDKVLEFVKMMGIPRPESILVSDTIFEGDDPAINYSLRGALRATVSLKTADKDVHSGLGGGLVANPVSILAYALSTCYNPTTGQVLIPGISETTSAPSGRNLIERRKTAQTYDLARYLKELGAGAVYPTENTDEALARMWHLPTFEIHNIKGPEGMTIQGEASALISMRLFGQTPEQARSLLEKYLKGINQNIQVTGGGIPSVEISLDSPFFQRADDAYEFGFGRRPVYVGVGGAIGAFPPMQQVYPGVPIVCMSMSKVTDGYHAPNEQFEFAQAERGIRTVANYLANIGDLRTA